LATQIQIKRGSTTPAGLTVGESAMNTSTNQIYLGGTGGTVLVGGEVTGGVDMGAGSAVSANRIPTQSGVYNYVRNSTVTSFNGLTGAVGGVTTSAANTFTALNTFNAGISAAGSTFSSTTNTLDVIASTEGAGLRIAKAVTGTNSRVGGIRLGRSGTTASNTYLEGSAGTFTIYNGVDNTANAFALFSSTAFTIGATTASQMNLNCPGTVQIGDATGTVTLHGQKFTLDGSTRFFTFGDNSGTTAGFVGINRAYNGLCADYALEVNSPTGKGLQLIYNDNTGAASNWVNMDVSSGGNYTLRPSGGLATVTGTLNVSAGVCAAGATFSGNVTAQSTLYTDNIQAIGNQINIANVASGRVAFGDYDGAGNSTFVFIRDATSSLLISNPNGVVGIGDPNNVGSGYALLYDAAVGSLDGNNSSLTNFSSGDFNGRLDMNGGYSERGATASQATNTITFNAASGNTQKFVPSAVVNTVNFTNINTASTQCTSATLIFLHGATPYGLTTGTFSVQLAGVTKTVKWSGGSAPTLTNTANKTDILNFLTYDGGTTWLGFVGGLNF
jgi:hypothetical protein